MKRSSCSKLLIVAVAALLPTASAETRRSFGGVPAFLQRKSSSHTTGDCLSRTENALYSTKAAQHCDNNKEPSDREIRYAVQRGNDEIRASRAVESAYLQLDDEEFPVIPASNTRVVPTNNKRPLDSDLYHV